MPNLVHLSTKIQPPIPPDLTPSKGTSSTAATGCFQLMGDSQQRSARIWCGEWVGKMFWETNIQIFCLANRLFVGFTEFFGWLHGWQRSFVMNVLLLRKDCFRHDLGKGGAYDDGTSSSNLLFGTVYVILLMAEILRHLGCMKPLYTV